MPSVKKCCISKLNNRQNEKNLKIFVIRQSIPQNAHTVQCRENKTVVGWLRLVCIIIKIRPWSFKNHLLNSDVVWKILKILWETLKIICSSLSYAAWFLVNSVSRPRVETLEYSRNGNNHNQHQQQQQQQQHQQPADIVDQLGRALLLQIISTTFLSFFQRARYCNINIKAD